MRFILLLLPIFVFFSFRDIKVTPIQKIPQATENYSQPFEAFPNPVDHTLTLQSSSFKNMEVELIIYDVSGKLVLSQQALIFDEDFKILLNLSELASGLYFVQIRKDNYSATKKIMKA